MKLLCANWKMNLGIAESAKLSTQLAELSKSVKSEIWAACTSAALAACTEAAKGSRLKIGSQNAYFEEKGAFTGENSPVTLKEVGAHFSLVGHSERRTIFAESNQLCAARAFGLIKHGISVIFCIGETLEERQSAEGQTLKVIEAQLIDLLTALSNLEPSQAENFVSKLILAYEPVWAIGTGLAATTTQIAEVHSAIPKVWAKYSNIACPKILYGGSMNKTNGSEILAVPGVDGGLIGGASNSYDSFSALIACAEELK